MPFFPDFQAKITALMPVFCQINFHSLRRCSHAHILSKKLLFSLKHCALMSFFLIFHINPLLSYPYLVRKMSILSKLKYFMGQKSQQYALIFQFLKKKSFLSCHYFEKICPFFKKQLMQCPYFVEKTIIFLRSQCSHVIFFKFFMKKPLISCPYLVKKRKFRENCNILWAKKAIKTSFFRIFNEKINALMYIFCKNVHKNTLFSCPYLLSIFCQKKRPFSQKHCALMSYCSIFS